MLAALQKTLCKTVCKKVGGLSEDSATSMLNCVFNTSSSFADVEDVLKCKHTHHASCSLLST